MRSALRAILCLLMLVVLGTATQRAQACVAGGCIEAGPRLASVSSSQSVLLNLLLGNLTGSSLNLSVADWNQLAQGNVSLASFLSALQTQLNVSNPSTALTTNASLLQVVNAAAAAATID